MKRNLVYYAVFLFMCVSASGAYAQNVNPCADDIEKFCAHLRPGSGIIVDCLNKNEAQLSPGCKAQHLAQLTEVLSQTQLVCESDSAKFCGAERQQQGIALMKCLRTNQPGLSSECREKLYKALELMHY